MSSHALTPQQAQRIAQADALVQGVLAEIERPVEPEGVTSPERLTTVDLQNARTWLKKALQ
jgi:hypothetical protein